MSAETSGNVDQPRYDWAIGIEPDAVYVQLPPIDTAAAGAALDAMRQLFRQRGFAPVAEDEDPADAAAVANGCALVRVDDGSALLVVSISDRVGATRVPVPHGDAAWSRRVFDAGQVLVVLTEAAIDGREVTTERLRRDADAGGLSAAVVPAGEL